MHPLCETLWHWNLCGANTSKILLLSILLNLVKLTLCHCIVPKLLFMYLENCYGTFSKLAYIFLGEFVHTDQNLFKDIYKAEVKLFHFVSQSETFLFSFVFDRAQIKGVRGWQFLTTKAAETLCIVCLPPEKHFLKKIFG